MHICSGFNTNSWFSCVWSIAQVKLLTGWISASSIWINLHRNSRWIYLVISLFNVQYFISAVSFATYLFRSICLFQNCSLSDLVQLMYLNRPWRQQSIKKKKEQEKQKFLSMMYFDLEVFFFLILLAEMVGFKEAIPLMLLE